MLAAAQAAMHGMMFILALLPSKLNPKGEEREHCRVLMIQLPVLLAARCAFLPPSVKEAGCCSLYKQS